jgi:hypothetical protein
MQPRNADAIPELEHDATVTECLDHADGLVPGDDRESWKLEVAFHDVEVGATAPARPDTNAHLARTGFRHVAFDEDERLGTDTGRAS